MELAGLIWKHVNLLFLYYRIVEYEKLNITTVLFSNLFGCVWKYVVPV